ncbi:FadR family transcriptional regulator [Colidextribacter sp. OB.20]|uniref:FadR/GntR family transcriptional regulator n=1 Tax=Colidextribacter sp. OB.20 TaxID=2304568 RepID=UPI00137165D4|nr:FadR/GntR family transcriptional regulator [Colidextribacter sp. OB.20]NBI09894.1 FadR family transcriptional regulator [Colidextribacter sp. OB.20]
MMMETITKKSATQLALENLRSYVMNDSAQVGDRFPTEKDLCALLGVGRGTVREAVKVLISQGLLEIRPGLGTFIKSKTPMPADSLSDWFLNNEVELQDLIVVRSTLEPLAAKLAIERCTGEQLSALKKNQAGAIKAAEQCDAAALAHYDEEFHRTIFVIAGNVLLIEINDIISRHLAQFRQNTFKIKNNIDNFIPAHDAIIRAFETQDTALGEKKMRQHMKKVAKDLESSKFNS